jgi:hypothetical protein
MTTFTDEQMTEIANNVVAAMIGDKPSTEICEIAKNVLYGFEFLNNEKVKVEKFVADALKKFGA